MDTRASPSLLLTMVLSVALLAPNVSANAWHYLQVEGEGGVPLNVATAGNPGAPAILFIHGLAQSHYSFVRQLDSGLAKDHFLVAFDLRGHGGSGKPWQVEAYRDPQVWARDVDAVIRATNLVKPVVVAWSYGTMVAMDYVRVFGVDRLAGLVLTGGFGGLQVPGVSTSRTPDAAAVAQFTRNRDQQLSRNLVDNIEVSARTAPMLTATPVPEPQRHYFESIALMFPAYARRAIQARSFDNQDLRDRLPLPVLLALGEKDFNVGQLEAARELARSRSHITVSSYENAGHSAFFEQPERFNAELAAFVRRAVTPREAVGRAASSDR